MALKVVQLKITNSELEEICWSYNRIFYQQFFFMINRSVTNVSNLDKTRFRLYCIDIYLFKTSLHYLLQPLVIIHFLLSPYTISHLQLLLIFSSRREIPHQSHLLPLNISIHHSIFLSCLLPPMLHLILACRC